MQVNQALLIAVAMLWSSAHSAEPPPAVAVIREEALRANLDPRGRPLPLAAQWHMTHTPLDYQMALIARGHHLLPFVPFPNPPEDPAAGPKKSKKKKAAPDGPTL